MNALDRSAEDRLGVLPEEGWFDCVTLAPFVQLARVLIYDELVYYVCMHA